MSGYGTDPLFETWMADNGFALPVDAPSPAALRQRGSVFIDGHDFPGAPTGGLAQERAWPRTGAIAYGSDVPVDVIPDAIVRASFTAAYYEALNPGSLTTNSSTVARIKRERVEGVTDVEYFGEATSDGTVSIPAVSGLLAPFLAVEAPAVALGLFALG